MTVLAFDLARRTGWASSDGRSGVHEIAPKGSCRSALLHGMLMWTPRLIAQIRPRVIAYEQLFLRGPNSRQLFGYAGILEAVAEGMGVPVLDVHNSKIKGFIAGDGGASKEKVMAAVRQRGYEPADDNEADAIALMLYVEATMQIV